ncbi:hypothetical protein M0R45_035650 [Rubus argutus]|uniref:Retrotransposon gag domain-containing protein n=1 Tax=Rubus argutus TaxID=59490 RepID=A0AAW1VWB5_RUBAR
MAPSRNTRRNRNTTVVHLQKKRSNAARSLLRGKNESTHQDEMREEEEITPESLVRALNTFETTQREMVATMKELITSISSKNSHEAQERNLQGRHFQEESAKESEQRGAGLEKRGTSFVTQEDVVAMLEKELRRTNEDWKYLPQPSYSTNLINRPYPTGYETPNFILFDGRKGSPREHISRFIDALGPHASDHNLRLREFSKTLTDRAYTWYTTLAPGSIHTWEDMASKFCKKYFEHEERVTISQLNATRQRSGENLIEFVRRFRDLALDCYDEKGEGALVEICIGNMLPEYRVYLENANIDTFSRLMDAVKKTSMSVKVINGHRTWKTEKRDGPQTLTVEDRPSSSNKRKDRETYPAVPCSDEEFHAILDAMFADSVIKPPRPYKNPSRKDKADPRYCRYHQILGHPTTACQTLRKILHGKIRDGTLELPSKKQAIDDDPLPRRRQGKETVAVVTCLDDDQEEEGFTDSWNNNQVPYLVTEPPEENLDLISWCEFSKPQGYETLCNVHKGQETTVTLEENATKCHLTQNKRQRSYPAASEVLQRNPKFKSLFDQLEYGPQARQAAAKALMHVSAEYGPQSFAAESSNNRAFLENHNSIIFTEEDMVAPYADHRRPLYLEAQVNEVFIRRALVDTGSSVNIVPLSVLKAAKIPTSRIVRSTVTISGFGNGSEDTLGYIQLDLKVGPIRSLTKFHVLNASVAYHVLLGRPWLNKHKLIVSTYHQCVKGRIGLRPICIPGNQTPFSQEEVHYSEAMYYDNFTQGSHPSKATGTPLPSRLDVRDLNDDEFEKGRSLTLREGPETERETIVGRTFTQAKDEGGLTTEETIILQDVMPAPKCMQDGSTAVAEPLEKVDLSDDPITPKLISINASLNPQEKEILTILLKEFKDVFAWSYEEMLGLDPGLLNTAARLGEEATRQGGGGLIAESLGLTPSGLGGLDSSTGQGTAARQGHRAPTTASGFVGIAASGTRASSDFMEWALGRELAVWAKDVRL